jgi:hypothetical protein
MEAVMKADTFKVSVLLLGLALPLAPAMPAANVAAGAPGRPHSSCRQPPATR